MLFYVSTWGGHYSSTHTQAGEIELTFWASLMHEKSAGASGNARRLVGTVSVQCRYSVGLSVGTLLLAGASSRVGKSEHVFPASVAGASGTASHDVGTPLIIVGSLYQHLKGKPDRSVTKKSSWCTINRLVPAETLGALSVQCLYSQCLCTVSDWLSLACASRVGFHFYEFPASQGPSPCHEKSASVSGNAGRDVRGLTQSKSQ